ncbi:MAG: CdaR family protein, partial [Acidobacteriota bacterium]
GTVPVTLRPEDVRFSLAGDFDVVSITPDRFTIQVEPRIEAVKPIRVELFGEPAAGASAGVPEPLPATATVSGPESRVVRLSSLTIAVSLDGHARTFTDIVPIASGDPLVRVESPASVRVQVPMQEPELSIRFEDLVEPSDSAS